MCGIAGFAFTEKMEEKDLLSMLNALAHRGPDGQGIQTFPASRTALGHRRLSILDLTQAGRQPLTYENSKLWLTFNGELYNFLEIRRELQSKGYHFYTETDSEVFLVAYMEWGSACFDRFNGMWAAAIYDENKRSLLLCRDRFGVKPMYYFRDNRTFAFASELKSFLSIKKELNLTLDWTGVRTSLHHPARLEASGHTWLKNVFSLPAGHLAIVQPDKMNVTRWWDMSRHISSSTLSQDQAIEEFQCLFDAACLIRMRSDVPIGSSLSGGIDSSSVVATMAKLGKKNSGDRLATAWQSVFTHTFPGSSLDEFIQAREVASYHGLNLTVIEPEKHSLEDLDAIILHSEATYLTPPTSMWDLYKAQRRSGIKVTLDGHGCDELLGGYAFDLIPYLRQKSMLRPSYWNLLRLKQEMDGQSGLIGRAKDILKTKVFKPRQVEWIERTFFLNRFLHTTSSDALYDFPKNTPIFQDDFSNYLYNQFHVKTLPRILKNFDILSMAHGMEVRMPFLDYRLVLFLFSLPSSYKINSQGTKWILRKSMEHRLPSSVLWRKRKIGFNSPVHEWLRTSLKDWSRDTIKNAHDFFIDEVNMKKLRLFLDDPYAHNDWFSSTEAWKILHTMRLIYLTKM